MKDGSNTDGITRQSSVAVATSSSVNTDASQWTKKQRVVYLGGFVDEAIVEERGLRSHNPAGSNRMYRISQALKAAGYQPVLLSPATSLRARSRGVILHPQRMRRYKGVPVVFAPVINIIGLNVFSSFIFQFLTLRALLRSGKVCHVVIYNFNPALVVLAAYLKYFRSLQVVNNIEDVSEPSIRDWSRETEARPLQQLVFYVCMNLIAHMSDAYVVPTRRFLNFLPVKKPAAVVTGCIHTEPSAIVTQTDAPIRVLFAGKVEREHGIEQFVRALQELDALKNPPRLRVDISGTGGMGDWVQDELAQLNNIEVIHHGFVSSKIYRELLRDAQICVALQDPKGRYADYKTPSKVYEFLGFGKAVIATDVGDIREISNDAILVIDELSKEAIAEKLAWLVADPARVAALQVSARRYSEEHFSYSVVGAVLRDLMSHKGRWTP